MHQTKRIGLLAVLLLAFAAVPAACSSTVATKDGCPESGLPDEGSACSTEGQLCGELDACGNGPQAACRGGTWEIDDHDPADGACGCGVPCESPCPATQPMSGSACGIDGTTCSYANPSCDEAGATATCSGGAWSVDAFGPSCLPICPTAQPVAGTPCNGCCAASNCAYLDAGGCPSHVSCENGVWVATADDCTPSSSCAPLAMGECTNANGCRWMEYSTCSPVQEFPQGCYPAADCATDADCSGGTTCKMVEADPCPAGDCNVCVAEAHICAP